MRGTARLTPTTTTAKDRRVSAKPIYLRLKDIRERAGISGSQIARDMGYKSPSGYLRYEQPIQGNNPIPYDVIKRLIPFLRGRGNPAVTAEELLALTDAKDIPKPIQQAFVGLVSDGEGLLAVRYRVEPGVYVRSDAAKSYGASRIGGSTAYPTDAQWVAVVTEGNEKVKANTQLHCVDPSAVANGVGKKRRVVIGIPVHEGIVEIATACTDTEGGLYGADGLPIEGMILGYVIGAYVPE